MHASAHPLIRQGNEYFGRIIIVAEPESPKGQRNRLGNETSPYLLQHADNPVDWYPWGSEAIERARSEDKPIFLSIGYSSCHWCHVMEHESFENAEIAAFLNEHFVSIKVDREERPDLDEIYMTAVQIMTQSGGWPMTVFLTPELKPFYGGTYFPPTDRWGRPGFLTVLKQVQQHWSENREKILESAEQLTGYISKAAGSNEASESPIDENIINKAADDLARNYDTAYGGFGPAPKFPSAPSNAVLLRAFFRTKNKNYLDMATTTLDRMASGGLYDQLGGGFHRYSVDEQWLAPHFEKMLYDNAQLAQAYIEAYQLTDNAEYRRIVEETFDYVLRDMTGEDGGFYSAENADSEGEEGKFYVWKSAEIDDALGEDAALFKAWYNVRDDGNFSSQESYHIGQNILHLTRSVADVANEFDMEPPALIERLATLKQALFEVREKRVRPSLDDKVIAAWNGLMMSAFAMGFQVLKVPRYKTAAEKAANFILTNMIVDGKLMRTYREGQARHLGCLDDHAFLVIGLIDLYEATFELRWLDEAHKLAQTMIDRFWDTDKGGFFYASEDHEDLIARTKPTYDGAEPSGNSMAALGLLRLAVLKGDTSYSDKAETVLKLGHKSAIATPRAYLKYIQAANLYVHASVEIALAGEPGSAEIEAFLTAIHDRFLPGKTLALISPDTPDREGIEKKVPLLLGKRLIDGKPAAFVCRDFACRQPVTTVEALVEELDSATDDFAKE